MTNPNPGSSAWPSNYQGCMFTARYLDSLGNPVVGTVTFTPSPTKVLDYAAATIIIPKPVTVALDNNGRLSVVLPATDDPDVSPLYWTYLVSENFAGGSKFYTDAPQNTTVDLCNASSIPQANGTPIVRGPTGLPGGVQTVQRVPFDQTGNVDLDGVFLEPGNNLSELTNRANARASLGLGDIATHAAAEFATEGEVQDRLQVGNNLSDLQSAPTARLNLGLGSAAVHAASDFAPSVADTGWQPLPLASGISTSTLTPAYRCVGGVVYFRGDIKGTSALGATNTYTIVPAGGIPAAYRPVGAVLKAVISTSSALGLLDFQTNGGIGLVVGPSSMNNVQFGDASYLLS